jgi:hypothetical protein
MPPFNEAVPDLEEEGQPEPDRIPSTTTTPIEKASPPMTSLGFRKSPRGVDEMGSVGVEVTRERRANMNERELQLLHSKAIGTMGETSLTDIYDLQTIPSPAFRRLPVPVAHSLRTNPIAFVDTNATGTAAVA